MMFQLAQAAASAFYLASVYCSPTQCMVGNLKQTFTTEAECMKSRAAIVKEGDTLPSLNDEGEFINIVCTEWSGPNPQSDEAAGQRFANYVMKSYGPPSLPKMEEKKPEQEG